MSNLKKIIFYFYKMQLVERHIIKKSKEMEDICFKCARLYNFVNYYKRQVCFGTFEKFGEYEVTGLLAKYKQEDFTVLPSNVAQQIVRMLFQDWSSYFKAIKDYAKNPSKYSGKPNIPKYKDKKGYSVCVFSGVHLGFKKGYIKFPKNTNLPPLKTNINSKDEIAQVRIVPKATCFVIEVVYNQEKTTNEKLDKSKFIALDLGLDNLATSINNVGLPPFIINGKVLKSVNQMYNKTKAQLMSHVGNRGTSNRIKQTTHYRNNFIEDKLHKASRFIVDFAIESNVGTIIIGKNKGWKDSINIGSVNNQKFVSIPHAKLIDKIRYKAEMVGIEVIETEESYTSKIDHLSFETLGKQENYLGKRKRRGLFQSATKKLINADVNGAIGMARKVFGDLVLQPIINSGLAFNPYRINIL